ncbi:radical SAM protein [Anaerosalibacter bizertensis]|uniref:4Fe-4S cluster-binding domain-containing protein n=1 Tax=Anaerosalibacter bizertensis TaxID=932217 RepID=UPI001C0EDE7C|nr:4Fe-4S cluster-binding domain-containing protein [Anaerosalibacter bizertensis]MBU5294776.1 radical SAM protein [Anaerosalibacter bizertensis]
MINNNYINIAGIVDTSCSDGPGLRTVLFLQGCNRNCEGCHNISISEHNEGNKYSIFELLNIIDLICLNKKITISGGEPLEQPTSLKTLLIELQNKNYDICLYTGNNLEDIPDDILKYLNYVKVGNFIKKQKKDTLTYYGSSNQSLYKIIEREDSLCLKEI